MLRILSSIPLYLEISSVTHNPPTSMPFFLRFLWDQLIAQLKHKQVRSNSQWFKNRLLAWWSDRSRKWGVYCWSERHPPWSPQPRGFQKPISCRLRFPRRLHFQTHRAVAHRLILEDTWWLTIQKSDFSEWSQSILLGSLAGVLFFMPVVMVVKYSL